MVEYHDQDFDWNTHAERVKPICDKLLIQRSAGGSPESESWSAFYEAHKSFKFFKPKRYLPKAFPTLVELSNQPKLQHGKSLLEIGCGYGSAAFPIIAALEGLAFHGIDVSARAVKGFEDKVKEMGLNRHRASAAVCNVADCRLPVEDATYDYVLLCFTLSAIAPERHKWVMAEARRVLKTGGVLMFRDYGLYDFVQLRCTKRVGLYQYLKKDGVQCFFFPLEYLTCLASEAGFEIQSQKYCTVKNVNRKTGEELHRVFVNAEYIKT